MKRFRTVNYFLGGIPDAVVSIGEGYRLRGAALQQNQDASSILNWITSGFSGQFEVVVSTPMSDPNYWRAFRNILATEAGAIAIYNSIAAGAELPTTTEELIRWGDRMGAPRGVVPSGTFDEAFVRVQQLGDDAVSLYRAVSPEEFHDIMEKTRFDVIPTGYEGKQFGLSLEETISFADHMPDAAAIIEARVPREILDILADTTQVDAMIFKSGTITINIDKLADFNEAIIIVNVKIDFT